MDIVGAALGAIALLDPAYKGLRGLYNGYKTTEVLGKDLQALVSSLNVQKWVSRASFRLIIPLRRESPSQSVPKTPRLVCKARIADVVIIGIRRECRSLYVSLRDPWR